MASLDSVYQKLYRAKHHFEELKQELESYYKSHPGDISVERTVERVRLEYVPKTPVPARFGLIAGDCLQTLRSSLDYLVWELVLANGQTPSYSNMFPITTSGDQFDNQLKRNRLQGVSEAALHLIASIQPFNIAEPETHPLAVLDSLTNINKHRRVILTDLVGSFSEPSIRHMHLRIKVAETTVNGDILRSFPVWASVRFAEGIPKGCEITSTLDALATTIGDEILPSFIRLFE